MTREEYNQYMKKYMRQYRKTHPEFVKREREHLRHYMQNHNAQLRKMTPWIFHYKNAIARCNQPSYIGYKNYGGRGIRMLLTQKEIEILYKRDEAGSMKRPSLHRIDNNSNYCFDNCQFIELSKNIRGVGERKRMDALKILEWIVKTKEVSPLTRNFIIWLYKAGGYVVPPRKIVKL